ncbi:hypothetical protein [Flaviaesturariibacter terrae]
MLSTGQYWLLAFCALLGAVLLFGVVKAGRLHGMPVYFPAFICLCGGVLLALSGRLQLPAEIRPGAAPGPAAAIGHAVPWLRVLVLLLLGYIIWRWLRPPLPPSKGNE